MHATLTLSLSLTFTRSLNIHAIKFRSLDLEQNRIHKESKSVMVWSTQVPEGKLLLR